MRRILFLLLIGVFLLSFVSAKDVIYIVTNAPEASFNQTMEDLGLSYDVVHNTDLYEVNFDNYRMILINNDHFVNWNLIPINQKPALVISSYHVADWGWSTGTSLISKNTPLHVKINTSNELAGDLPADIQVYNLSHPDYYYLDKMEIYQGFEFVASNPDDNKDAVVAAAKAGTTLVHDQLSTQVNANSVYFGITETAYWTNETKELFRNCLMWIAGIEEVDFNINLRAGENLVSFPLNLNSNQVNDILQNNPEIVSVKEYDEIIKPASSVEPNKGYFLKSNFATTLTVRGIEPRNEQSVDLDWGMNLVGIGGLNNLALSTLPSAVIEVARRNADGSYTIARRYGGSWLNDFELEPGRGYWFKTNAGVTWDYTLN